MAQTTPSIIVVDYPLLAEGIVICLKQAGFAAMPRSSTQSLDTVPTGALVLIELFLPTDERGLQAARVLADHRKDVVPLVWSVEPQPLYLWAGLQYELRGFLDKRSRIQDLLFWLRHVAGRGQAWPTELWEAGMEFEREVALRLRGLPTDMWQLWLALFQMASYRQLARQLGWSARSVERRASELYVALGVDRRLAAVRFAWEWNLVKFEHGAVRWSAAVEELLIPPNSTGP